MQQEPHIYFILASLTLFRNAGQLGLGSSRPESSWPGSTRPNNISAWSYFGYFFIRDASMNCVLYIKCSAKVWGNNDWFYLYCWSVKLVSINGSDFTTVRETDKKYIFELFILIFFLSKKRKKSAVPVYDGSYIFTNIWSIRARTR